ncbi:hypothetical protein GDO81_010953 [Engystomops pustulosus]|uniref:Uncharacterized protein n=1 Tax=Engystomops pustulosus TaxID=76066 RepID=A0AAV7C3P9_ENGPU|nr:hypothetical protein GDO81_010953 [Engystomops pustulosus]
MSPIGRGEKDRWGGPRPLLGAGQFCILHKSCNFFSPKWDTDSSCKRSMYYNDVPVVWRGWIPFKLPTCVIVWTSLDGN